MLSESQGGVLPLLWGRVDTGADYMKVREIFIPETDWSNECLARTQ